MTEPNPRKLIKEHANLEKAYHKFKGKTIETIEYWLDGPELWLNFTDGSTVKLTGSDRFILAEYKDVRKETAEHKG